MFKPKKEWGQNFLTDTKIVNKMVENLETQPGDTIIEIGPGLGIITESVVKHTIGMGVEIYAVEIDPDLVIKLNEEFLEDINLHTIESDILKWLPKFEPKHENIRVIGSLPYYITSPILHTIIKMRVQPKTAILIIQKEVAEKVCGTPPKANYLSSFTQTFFETKYLGIIKKKKFMPKPKVDGGMIKLIKMSCQEISHEQIEKYEEFLHKVYAKPRKMLNKVLSKKELKEANLEPNLRPQNINVEKWINTYKTLTTQQEFRPH